MIFLVVVQLTVPVLEEPILLFESVGTIQECFICRRRIFEGERSVTILQLELFWYFRGILKSWMATIQDAQPRLHKYSTFSEAAFVKPTHFPNFCEPM